MTVQKTFKKVTEEATFCLDWGKIVNTYSKDNKRALDKQQKNLFNIISGNFEILKQQIAEFKK